jgi:hypothetical protein
MTMPSTRPGSVQRGADGRYLAMQARLAFRPKPRRLRCCGRWCFWRPPLGPWRCGECGRDHAGPMPRNAEHRLYDWALSAPAVEWSADSNRPRLDLFFRDIPAEGGCYEHNAITLVVGPVRGRGDL